MRYLSLLCSSIGLFTCFAGCMQGQSEELSGIQFAEKMLLKNEMLRDYYEINNDGISMYSSPEAKRNGEPEISIGKR